jgi:uncharacterized membrane protein YwaF
MIRRLLFFIICASALLAVFFAALEWQTAMGLTGLVATVAAIAWGCVGFVQVRSDQ